MIHRELARDAGPKRRGGRTAARRIALLVMTLGCVAAWHAACWRPAVAADVPSLQEILSAWRQRERAVSSGRFEWRGEMTELRGSVSRRSPRSPPVAPPEDTTFERRHRLVIDGQRSRHEFHGPIWNSDLAQYKVAHDTDVFDGQLSKMLLTWEEPGPRFNPSGLIRKEKVNPRLHDPDCAPVLLCIRPLTVEMAGFQTSDFTEGVLAGEVGGVACVVLTVNPELLRLQPRCELFVDRRPPHVIRRQAIYGRGNELQLQIDAEYEEAADATVGPMPRTWRLEIWFRGDLMGVERCTMTNMEVNKTIDEKEFAIEFPPRCMLTDEREPEHGREFVVREDGSKREIPPADYGATADQLLATPPGQARQQAAPARAGAPWLLIVNVAVLLGVTILIWRRRKGGPARTSRS